MRGDPVLIETIRAAVIGDDEAVMGPFGLRRVTYADYTASGRSLSFIEDYIRERSEGNSFHPIVAFGATGAHAHYAPSPTRKLEKGQMVLLDFGAIHQGYCGDLTRMICMGKADARLWK